MSSPQETASGRADLSAKPAPPRRFSRLRRLVVGVLVAAVGTAAYVSGLFSLGQQLLSGSQPGSTAHTSVAATARTEPKAPGFYKPTEAQWVTLGTEIAGERAFRTTLTTDGKIAIDEDKTTPMFSPYAGRVTKLFVKPGDAIAKGAPLFTVEASDMVQGQNDFLSALANVNKARSQRDVAAIVVKRHRDLLAANAVARREFEQAEIAHVAAVNDLKAAETGLDAARNRLRILGKSDADLNAFEQGTAQISADTPVVAPLKGTIVQRKVGPGQFVSNSSNDPVFVIGDLSTVWIVANVRETDATRVRVGQSLEFTTLAEPERVYAAKIDYIAAAVNPDTHRLQVRATVDNTDGLLRPEMFANVSIVTSGDLKSVSIPRQAVIFEGDVARVWVVRADKSIEVRKVTLGAINGSLVQVTNGVAAGEQIVSRGTLFIDRLASGDAG